MHGLIIKREPDREASEVSIEGKDITFFTGSALGDVSEGQRFFQLIDAALKLGCRSGTSDEGRAILRPSQHTTVCFRLCPPTRRYCLNCFDMKSRSSSSPDPISRQVFGEMRSVLYRGTLSQVYSLLSSGNTPNSIAYQHPKGTRFAQSIRRLPQEIGLYP